MSIWIGRFGLDAEGWRRMLISRDFEDSSNELCGGISNMVKKLCIDEETSQRFEALLASHWTKTLVYTQLELE